MDWIFDHIIAKAPPAMTAKNVKYRRGSRRFIEDLEHIKKGPL
jgi:hypothetical protein